MIILLSSVTVSFCEISKQVLWKSGLWISDSWVTSPLEEICDMTLKLQLKIMSELKPLGKWDLLK